MNWINEKLHASIRLQADGVEHSLILLEGDTNFTFIDLPKYNKSGSLIKYTISADPILNFNTVIDGDAVSGFKILWYPQ